ncbi:MAG: GNAT family N-acetyltransferase [Gammaproteobacteria bacterium]
MFRSDALNTSFPRPLALEGAHVRLEPLTVNHLDALCTVGLDPELWQWVPNPVRNRDEML